MRAVYVGSFDPIHMGHMDVIVRAMKFVDHLTIGIGINDQKPGFLKPEHKLSLIQDLFKEHQNVSVETYSGLTVEFATKHQANYVIRSFRNSNDFRFEQQLAQNNRILNPEIESLLLFSLPEYASISSSLVREVLRCNGPIEKFVPPQVAKLLRGI